MKHKHTSAIQHRSIVIFSLIAILLIAVSFTTEFNSRAQKFTKGIDAKSQEIFLAGNITGRVFQDFNGNGTYDTTLTIANDGEGTIPVAIDRGIGGVEVRAYNSAGVNVTTGSVVLSAAGTGIYTITTNDAGSGPYRIEFTALPTGYLPSARSKSSVGSGTATNSGSTTQFVSTPAADVNLAVNYPTDYSQNNPEVVASMYVDDDQLVGGNNSLPVLESFPYSAGSNNTTTAATAEPAFDAPTVNPLDIVANQVGTTYGLAYARRTRTVYAAAYFKRHAGFGPQGPNAIYRISRTGTGSVTGFFTVPGPATNNHQLLPTPNYNRDNGNTGWNAVGTSSIGGIALSEDESTLYAMNLENRTLYALNATTGAVITSQPVPTAGVPLPTGTCDPADVRPFAVTMYHGQLYVGMVCSAQSTNALTTGVDTFTDGNGNGVWDQGDYFIDTNNDGVRNAGPTPPAESYFELTGNTVYNAPETFTDVDGNGIYNIGNARNLRAYVYSVNPTTLAFGSPVFQMPLNYKRGLTTHTQSAMAAWRPWSDIYRNGSTNNTRTVYAQPMLTDIAFDNGNLILAFRDRVGDQVGNGALSNPNDASNTTLYQPRTGGDVIRACGTQNTWTVEANGRCGGTGTAPQNVAEGPGGAEFYFGDAYDIAGDFVSPAVTVTGKGGNHDDTGNGGAEVLPGAPDVIISNFDPVPNIPGLLHDGGIRWLNNTTGAFTKAYRLYNGAGDDTTIFGKAGGIGGNLTLLSDPAPIEIGNRVWRDANSNGVQDPGELPIAGITVRLYQGSTLVGTAVTDANGEYYFVFSTVVDPTPGDNIGQVNGGIQYNTAYQVRFDNPANYGTGGALNGLLITRLNQTSQLGDDDSSDSDAVTVANPPGSPSAGNFPVISLTTGGPGSNNHTFDIGFAAQPTSANVSVEGRVVLLAGNGVRNATVILTEANGTQHVARTGSFGYYRFAEIESGQSVVVSVVSKRFTFNPSSRFISLIDSVADLDFIAQE